MGEVGEEGDDTRDVRSMMVAVEINKAAQVKPSLVWSSRMRSTSSKAPSKGPAGAESAAAGSSLDHEGLSESDIEVSVRTR